VVAFRADKVSGSHTANNNWQDVADYTSTPLDTHGGFNPVTGVYTVKVPGVYDILARVAFDFSSSGRRIIRVQINDQDVNCGAEVATSTVTAASTAISASGVFDLKAGDTVKMVAFQASGGSLAYRAGGQFGTSLSIAKRSGPAQVAASESVYVEASSSATTAITSTATAIPFATKVKDTHGSWSTDTFTANTSGFYDVSALITLNDTSNFSGTAYFLLELYKDGSVYRTLFTSRPASGADYPAASGSTSLYLNADQTLKIYARQNATASISLTGNATENWLVIKRVGN